ncbi:hypothetical protein QVD17_12079 [Tagetes erecta]|uniref:Uncharacterized protein n=1 Tax=Tagetes erecta TaxID=13708 RepID=A0AAD8NVH6_TARER|nr:hypothetical protein QVD17_12079 [Tagetes erecta]
MRLVSPPPPLNEEVVRPFPRMRLYLVFSLDFYFFITNGESFYKKYIWQNAIRRVQSKVHLAFFQHESRSITTSAVVRISFSSSKPFFLRLRKALAELLTESQILRLIMAPLMKGKRFGWLPRI